MTAPMGGKPSEIENTTERMKDPAEMLLFLAEGMSGDTSAPVYRQERDGQRQIVNSDRLPSDFRDRADWEALGFAFGEPDPGDPLFMPAKLPEGWSREGSDHAMWSYLLDQHGRRRAAIFYKAAFYDRRAFMRLESLDSYVTAHVEYDGPLVLTGDWATRETVIAALARLRDEQKAEAARFQGYAGESHREDGNRAELRRYAEEYEEKAAKYAARLSALTQDDGGAR